MAQERLEQGIRHRQLERIPVITMYVISTKPQVEEGLVALFRGLPVQMYKLHATDFYSGQVGLYPGMGVDRVANVTGALLSNPAPVLVIDGGTAMTYTSTDSQGTLQGGGIGPGLRSKFRALFDYTGALPYIKNKHVEATIRECEEKQEPLPLLAQATDRAMMGTVFRETALLLTHVVTGWVRTFQQGQDTSENAAPQRPTVVVTGGDADILEKLLKPKHSYIVQESHPDLEAVLDQVRVEKTRNLVHRGIQRMVQQKQADHAAAGKTDEMEAVRLRLIGQRVAVKKSSGGKIRYGNVIQVHRGSTLDEDVYDVFFDDHLMEPGLRAVELYDGLMLYAQRVEEGGHFRLDPDDPANKRRLVDKGVAAKDAAVALAEKSASIKQLLESRPPAPAPPPAAADASNKRPRQGQEERPSAKKQKSPGPTESKDKEALRRKDAQTATDEPRLFIGTRVAKYFDDDETPYAGSIVGYTSGSEMEHGEAVWHISYDDGDAEDIGKTELLECTELFRELKGQKGW
jgi:pantothenate kinase type III